jgi:hypothetical protein
MGFLVCFPVDKEVIAFFPTTQHQIPEELHPYQHNCARPKI